MYVLSYIAAVVNSSKPRTDAEIHVRQEAMLGISGAHSDSAWIPILNLNIDVADGRIKRSGIRVWRLRTGRWELSASRRVRIPNRGWAKSSKKEHVGWILLKALPVCS